MRIPELPQFSKEPFADSAHVYRDAGLCPVPCDDKEPNRLRWGSWKHRPGDKFLAQLVVKFGADNVGVLTGKRSGVFIVDIDDDALVLVMLERFGDTQLISATPSGGVHLWYKWNGERCSTLRPEYLVDLKGEGGFIVAPPSYRRDGEQAGQPCHFIKGGLEDVPNLPTIKPESLPGPISIPDNPKITPRLDGKITARKSRNLELFTAVKEAGPKYDANGLIAFACRYNETQFTGHPDGPLSNAEVDKVATSVWRYKTDGNLLLKGLEPFVQMPLSVIEAFVDNPDGFWLDALLRAHHGGRSGAFAVSPKAMAAALPKRWSHVRIRKTRDALVEAQYLNRVRKGKTIRFADGTFKTGPNLYELADIHQGNSSLPNITIHPSPLYSVRHIGWHENTELQIGVPEAAPIEQATVRPDNVLRFGPPDLFGASVSVPSADIDGWERGIPSPEVRRALKAKMRIGGMTQDDLAHLVGLSRPQLTNGLQGRYGFGIEATAKLKLFLKAP